MMTCGVARASDLRAYKVQVNNPCSVEPKSEKKKIAAVSGPHESDRPLHQARLAIGSLELFFD
jgi:hypothetical protein